ncbi:putative polysaccharide-degrading enzyme [Fulvivirga imtechensis AK7]|uniref:Putative polysaccharide-degrading enzyme n=2 Tax=Fulvivirga TaxID=396811 RepID=L8JKG3_9BACT|nr:putative polysaccharide-degrading enzyme [Fulvivirga imtechensis AK7]
MPAGFIAAPVCEPSGSGAVFEVGPGKAYENIIDVPFENLGPGDVVKIYAKPDPYYERIILTTARGTAGNPVCICGVPDGNGNLPVLDGTNAAVRPVNVNTYFNDITAYLGVIVIANEWDNHPEHIQVKNLIIQGAHQYSNDGNQKYKVMGTSTLEPYSPGAAGIWMRGTDIEVSNCIIQENGNGVFGAYNGPENPLTNVKLYNNVIRNNGTYGGYRHHNVYLEADSLIVKGNLIGPIRDGSLGINLKSRSAGEVVMYNKLQGPASRHFDFVESQNGYDWLAQKASFRRTIVAGNIVVGVEGGAGNILHYGGDGDNTTPSDDLRQGTIYAYNNTFLLRGYYLTGDPDAVWRQSFTDLNTCNEKLYAFNNIWAYHNPRPDETSDTNITIFRYRGVVDHFSHNLVAKATNAWYNDKTDGDPCLQGYDFATLQAAMASNSDLSFVDLDNDDLHLAAGSVAIDAGVTVPVGLPAIDHQFVMPNSLEERHGCSLDIGAYEL